MAAIGAMGLAKLVSLPHVVQSLRTWELIPSAAVPLPALFIPTVEFTGGVMWCVNLHRSAIRLICISWIALPAGAYLLRITIWGPVRCGCMGAYGDRFSDHPAVVLGRAGLLLGLLVFGRSRLSNA
jgi:hypothetical protein